MRHKIRRFFIAVFSIAALILAILIILLLFDYRKVNESYKDLAGKYVSLSEEKLVTAKAGEDAEYDEIAPIKVESEKLDSSYSDYRAWLYCEGTKINYPVMQGKTNDTYLHAMADGSYSFAGCIFMDSRNSADFSDLKTILYGHNMLNDSMFGSLDSYENLDYATEHDCLYLMTPLQNYRLEVIGAICIEDGTSSYSLLYNDSELQSFISYVRMGSFIPTMHDENSYNKVCCLSTCSYAFENARMMLVCGMVPIG